jgi:hypothetical protein
MRMRDFAVLTTILAAGFFLGRISQPSPVKAAGVPYVIHIDAPTELAPVPGSSLGTAVAISCTHAQEGDGDCYVLMQRN